MSTESPPGSSRPNAGGEFTWPPTNEELEAIQVIPLDDATFSRASLLPAPLEASAATVAPAIKRRFRLRPPRRDDLWYLGITFASVLAIAVAATSQLSDWQLMPSPPATTSAAASPTTSSASDLEQLRPLEKPPDLARAALAATPAPLAALEKDALPAAPVKKVADTRPRRTRRVAQAYVRPRLITPENNGRRGKVVLWVEVRKNGKVGDVDVLSSDLDRSDRSQRDLQRAAVSAVKRWRYTPAMRDGEPTDTRVRVVVDINLDSRAIRTTTEADARRRGAAANRVADSVRAAR